MKPRYFLIWFCVAFYFEAATENVMCSSLQSAWHDTFSILCCKYTTHAYQLCFKQSNCPGFFAVVSNHTCCYHSNYWCHEARTEILRIRTVLIKLRTFALMKFRLLQKPPEIEREVQGSTLTSPASCEKTLRNCFSSSLSCCSAYWTGLRGGGCVTEAPANIH